VSAAALPNKGMKLTKPGQLQSFAAYPRCSADVDEHDRPQDWGGCLVVVTLHVSTVD